MTIENGRLIPAKGKFLRNIMTDKVFRGEIALGKYDSIENYEEIDTYEIAEADMPAIEAGIGLDKEHKPQI